MSVLWSQPLQSNARWNSRVFSRCLKQASYGDVVRSGGKLFYTRGPATLKARSPVTQWVGGTSSADVDAECSRHQESMFATKHSSCARYYGALPRRQWKMRMVSLNSIHWGTHNQWRLWSSSVMCSNFCVEYSKLSTCSYHFHSQSLSPVTFGSYCYHEPVA